MSYLQTALILSAWCVTVKVRGKLYRKFVCVHFKVLGNFGIQMQQSYSISDLFAMAKFRSSSVSFSWFRHQSHSASLHELQ